MTGFKKLVVSIHTALRAVDASDTTIRQTDDTNELISEAHWHLARMFKDGLVEPEYRNLALQCLGLFDTILGHAQVLPKKVVDSASDLVVDLEKMFNLSPFPSINQARNRFDRDDVV